MYLLGGKSYPGSESPSDQSVILLVDDGSATGQKIRKDLPFGVSLWMGDKGWAWKGLVAPKGWCGWGWNKGKSEGRTGWHGLCVPFPPIARLRALASGHTTFLKPEEQDSEGRGSEGVWLLEAWPWRSCPFSLSQPPGNAVLILGSCFLQSPAMYMSQILWKASFQFSGNESRCTDSDMQKIS